MWCASMKLLNYWKLRWTNAENKRADIRQKNVGCTANKIIELLKTEKARCWKQKKPTSRVKKKMLGVRQWKMKILNYWKLIRTNAKIKRTDIRKKDHNKDQKSYNCHFFSNYSFSKRLPSGNTGILMMLNSQFFLLAFLRRKSYSTFSVLRPSANNRNKVLKR